MVEPTDQLSLDGSAVDCRWCATLDDAVEHARRRVVLNKEELVSDVRIDDEKTCDIGHQSLWLDGLYRHHPGIAWRVSTWAGVTRSTRPNVLRDLPGIFLPDTYNQFHLPHEGVNLLWVDVFEHRAFATRAADTPALVQALSEKARERLAGQMPNGLLRLCAAEYEKPQMRVGQAITDESFNAEIFRMQCPDNGKSFRGMVDQLRHELAAVQRADGNRGTVADYLIVAWQWRPARPFLGGSGRTEIQCLTGIRKGFGKSVRGNGWIAHRTPKTIIGLGPKCLACLGECGCECLTANRRLCESLYGLVQTATCMAFLRRDRFSELGFDDVQRLRLCSTVSFYLLGYALPPLLSASGQRVKQR